MDLVRATLLMLVIAKYLSPQDLFILDNRTPRLTVPGFSGTAYVWISMVLLYTLGSSHHPAQCAVRFALAAPEVQVWHAAPGQKNRKVLAQLVYKVLGSVKFNMTFIYLLIKMAE